MSIRISLTALALIAHAAVTAVAQTRPDFSGRWTVEPAPTSANAQRNGDMGSGWGSTITMTQTSAALTLEWPYYTRGDLQPPLVFVYPLDGSEKTNTLMMGRGLEKQVSRTAWNGDKLVITTTQAFSDLVPGQTVMTTVVRTLSLQSPTSMLVETTRSGVLGGRPSTTQTVYKKS